MSLAQIVAFATTGAIKDGDMDGHLDALAFAIKQRKTLLDKSKPPSRVGLEQHRTWAWMNGPGSPHWEVRGTGALL